MPKRDLVGVVQVLLQRRRLRIAQGLSEAETLLTAMEAFRVQISASGRDTYGTAAEAHDDLVLAVALAAWWGELLMARPVVEEVEEAPLDAWALEVLAHEAREQRRVRSHRPTREIPPEAVT